MRHIRSLVGGGVAALAALLPVSTLLAVAPAGPALASTTAARASCTAGTGPYQTSVESYLGLPVDGRNSSSDCERISAFQAKYGISPAAGYAGPTTYGLVQRFRSAASRATMCPVRSKVICVDLTSQVMWVAQDGRRTFGYYPVRSGRDGYETRTGSFTVHWKDIDHVSSIYGSPMPYSMFFSGGQAFHVSDRYLFDEPGSHGCVHLARSPAAALYAQTATGTAVYVFGRKPGT